MTCAANPVNSFTWRAEPSGFGSAAVATVTTAQQKPIQRLRSESDDSAASSDESPNSDDGAPAAKKKCQSNRRLDSSSSCHPTSAARPATKYGIWGSVLQEQTLAKDLSGWFGMNSKVISDRDVETYDYRKSKNRFDTFLCRNQDPHFRKFLRFFLKFFQLWRLVISLRKIPIEILDAVLTHCKSGIVLS